MRIILVCPFATNAQRPWIGEDRVGVGQGWQVVLLTFVWITFSLRFFSATKSSILF